MDTDTLVFIHLINTRNVRRQVPVRIGFDRMKIDLPNNQQHTPTRWESLRSLRSLSHMGSRLHPPQAAASARSNPALRQRKGYPLLINQQHTPNGWDSLRSRCSLSRHLACLHPPQAAASSGSNPAEPPIKGYPYGYPFIGGERGTLNQALK